MKTRGRRGRGDRAGARGARDRVKEGACASAVCLPVCLSECDTVFARSVSFLRRIFRRQHLLFLLSETSRRTPHLRNPSARGEAGLSPSLPLSPPPPPPPCIPSHTQPSRPSSVRHVDCARTRLVCASTDTECLGIRISRAVFAHVHCGHCGEERKAARALPCRRLALCSDLI